MGTPFSEIFDLFLVGVKDYKIDKLYSLGSAIGTPFFSYLEGFLVRAIPNFTNCVSDLDTVDNLTKTFDATLSSLEKNILADLMEYEWFKKEINDVTQFNLTLSDTDFKHFSEAQNLREKEDKADRAREKYEQKMTVYGLKHIPWVDWSNGIYG